MKVSVPYLPKETIKEGSRITFLYLMNVLRKPNAPIQPSYRMRDWKMIFGCVLWVLLLLSVIGIIFLLKRDFFSCLFALCLFVFLSFSLFRWIYATWKFYQDTETLLDGKMTITADKDAIHVKREKHPYSIPWNSIRVIAVNPHSVLFLPYHFGEPCLLVPIEYKMEMEKMIREEEWESLIEDYTK